MKNPVRGKITKKIYSHFAKTVDDYDYVADKVVMKNEELHDVLFSSIPHKKNRTIRVLDLGCGTGHGMKILLEMFPNSFITGIDYSSKMTTKASRNLKKFKGRFELIERDFTNIDFEGVYDVVVSAIAIHNNTHEQKKKLFKKISLLLRKGGVFINGDFVKGETKELDDSYGQIYKQYLEHNLKNKELKVWLHHAFEEDMPMKISQQFRILRRLFSKVSLTWQFANETIYVCTK